MGLDISAYSRLTKAEPRGEDGEHDWQTQMDVNQAVLEQQEREWPGRAGELEAGVYDFADSVMLRAGSYSDYNEWRDTLARFAGFISAADVWRNPREGAFVEMINFSDCEGVIEPAVAAKLAKDFQDHAGRAAEYGNEWWVKKYAAWQKAFELAADRGAVVFH